MPWELPVTRPLQSLQFMQTFSGKLERALSNLSRKQFPPDAKRQMRKFQLPEAANLLGVTEAYLRQVLIKGQGPTPETTTQGKRHFSVDQLLEMRMHLAERGRKKGMNPRRVDGEECQIIAITNFKGGSSKTCTSIHLGHYLALKGYRVLAVDLDPQASLTTLHGVLPKRDDAVDGDDVEIESAQVEDASDELQPEGGNETGAEDDEDDEGDTLYSAIRFDQPIPTSDLIYTTHIPGFDVICAGLELTEFETAVALGMRNGGGTAFLLRIAQALEQVADRYDVILLDCAPSLNFLTLASLTAATGVLIPVPAHMLDVDSTGKFLELAASYMNVLNVRGSTATAQWDFAKFLITKFEPNDHPQANMHALMRQVFGEDLLLNAVNKSTAVADALTWKQSLYEVQRSRFTAPKTYDRAIESINAVNAEIERLLWKAWGRVE